MSDRRRQQLIKAWEAYAKKNQRTIKWLGEQMGMSRANVSEYLSGDNRQNLVFVLRFCLVTGTDPYEIDPELEAIAPLFNGERRLGIDDAEEAVTKGLAALSAYKHRTP